MLIVDADIPNFANATALKKRQANVELYFMPMILTAIVMEIDMQASISKAVWLMTSAFVVPCRDDFDDSRTKIRKEFMRNPTNATVPINA